MKTTIKQNTILIFTLLFIIILLSACVKKVGNKDLTFNEQILPIFTSNCAGSGCHNAQHKAADLDLSNYNGIMQGVVSKHPLLSSVYTTIKGNNPQMPIAPYSKLKSKDVELIKLWINMGAPNSISSNNCDTTNIVFSNHIQPLLQSWCVSCHNSSNSSAGIDLSNYDGVKASINNNRLLGSIKYLNGFIKMPQNGSQLSSCDIAKIEKWVREGSINN